jgi:GMP synthase (glutamine-hydrolysing)
MYSEMLPCTQRIADLDFAPKGIILSGGPHSVYAPGSPHVDPAIFDLGKLFLVQVVRNMF